MAEKSSIPTQEEIAVLPREAQIAFAARCARRVQPLFTHYWPDAPKEHIDAVEAVIAFAESPPPRHKVASARAAFAAAAAAIDGAAGRAVFDAAAAAADAAITRIAIDVVAYAARAAGSAEYAADAAAAARAAVAVVIRQDYEKLKAAAKENGWTDDTYVPPSFFGPMWPDGAPKGWPELSEENSEGCRLEYEIHIPEGVSDEDVKSHILELVEKLDDYHRTLGGHGLTIEKLELYQDAGMPVSAGGGK